jgi:hypothetical protein
MVAIVSRWSSSSPTKSATTRTAGWGRIPGDVVLAQSDDNDGSTEVMCNGVRKGDLVIDDGGHQRFSRHDELYDPVDRNRSIRTLGSDCGETPHHCEAIRLVEDHHRHRDEVSRLDRKVSPSNILCGSAHCPVPVFPSSCVVAGLTISCRPQEQPDVIYPGSIR